MIRSHVESLHGHAGIHEVDLDTQTQIPREHMGTIAIPTSEL